MSTNTQSPSRSACDESPVGAHHWVLGMPSATMTGRCKYCQAEREFSPYEDQGGFNNSRRPKTPSA